MTAFVQVRGASVPYEIVSCYACGTTIAIESSLYAALLENKKLFWCPQGHEQHFTGKNLKEQLAETKAQLESEKKKREWAEQSARAEKERADRALAAKKRLRKRVKNGVCPDCNRTFQNLQRHMATKHGHSHEEG